MRKMYLKSLIVSELVYLFSRHILLVLLVISIGISAAFFEGASMGCVFFAVDLLSTHARSTEMGWMDVIISGFLHSGFSPDSLFGFMLTLAVLAQLTRTLLVLCGKILSLNLSLKMQKELQVLFYNKIMSASFMSISKYKTGDLVEYAKQPTFIVQPLLDSTNTILISFCQSALLCSMLFYLSPFLTFIIFILVGCFYFFQKKFMQITANSSIRQTNVIVDLTKDLVQFFGAIRLIHTYNRKNYILERLSQLLEKVTKRNKELNMYSHLIPAMSEVFAVALISIVIFANIFFNALTISAMFSYIMITYRLSARMNQGLTAVATFSFNWGHFSRAEHILNFTSEEVVDQEEANFGKSFEAIEMRGISLKYDGTSKYALEEVDLKIRKGERVALVGPSGAGKSSIIDLMTQLYSPTKGEIFINDVKLGRASINPWRQLLGVVNQDVVIFNDTIENNIRFGKIEASHEEIVHAAVQAHAHEFIQSLPQGYQTIVGERGAKLSGGERQRISLARAFVRKSQVLLLDEATSSLDSRSESLVYQAIKESPKSLTVIAVAHRLSSIVDYDVIYYFEKGRVIGKGSHSSLLHTLDKYRYLWEKQMGTIQYV